MADRTTKVTLTAQVQGYVDGMAKAAQATRATGSEAEKLAQKREAFERLGRASMVAGTTIAVGLGLAAKAAIDWDSAWAGVTKTVEGSPQQLAEVEAGLRGLTDILPASHTEIAAVAEAAGQLGIETPNVVAFTKTMIDLGETTNLSAEEAAMSLARFVNIMGTSQGDVDRLGSALVGLGNNFATTESEILAMSMRLAKSGVQIGLSEGEVLGLATALSSVGIEAEAGGSAMSKVMIDIAASVETGSDKLDLFAKTAGMSADEFAHKWKSSPAEALAAFVKGLSNAEAQGSSTLSVLAELGITEVRMRDALLGSAAAADQFAGAMEMGNAEFEKNSALTEEADKRYETVAAKLSIAKNQIVDMAISLGDHLLPAIGAGAEAVGNFADILGGMDGPMGAVVAWGGLIAAGILLTGGVAMSAVPKIAAYKVALETLGWSAKGLLGTLGPIGAAATLASAAIAGLDAASRSGAKSTAELKSALTNSKSEVDALTLSVKDQAAASKFFIGSMTDGLKDLSAILEEEATTSGFWKWLNQDFADAGVIDRVQQIGSALAEISATDFSQAQKSFASLRNQYDLTDKSAQQMISAMPEFRDALIAQADAAGLATDDTTLLKLAMGHIKPAADDATKGVDDNSEALSELEGRSAATSQELSDLADVIRGLGSAQLDLREANRQLEQSYADFTAAVETNGWTLDVSTDQGRAVEAALDGMAEAAIEAAAATLEQSGSQDEMNAKLADGRERIIDMIAPYFETRDAAAAYVDQLGLIAPEKVTKLVNNAPAAKKNVEDYSLEVSSIDPSARTTVTADVSQATAHLAMVQGQLQEIRRGAAINIGVFGAAVGANADGGIYAYADGGIAAYASGGISEGIYKGGAPIHKFAEPETGWEAYISGKPSERDRNRKIWAETGSMLGMNSAGGGGPTVVSLAGAVFKATIDGRPITMMIDEQIAGALAPVSEGSVMDRLGVHA